jgi:hypothetical protein
MTRYLVRTVVHNVTHLDWYFDICAEYASQISTCRRRIIPRRARRTSEIPPASRAPAAALSPSGTLLARDPPARFLPRVTKITIPNGSMVQPSCGRNATGRKLPIVAKSVARHGTALEVSGTPERRGRGHVMTLARLHAHYSMLARRGGADAVCRGHLAWSA